MTIALTYNLCGQCGNARPFCRKCVNSFCISGPCKSRCKDGPATICLVPRLPGGLAECTAKCLDDEIPRYWLATLLLDDVIYGPWGVQTGANCAIGGQFSLPNTLDYHGNGNIILDLSAGTYRMLRDALGIGPVWDSLFSLDQTPEELLEGDGCNRILTFTNEGIYYLGGSSPPDGSILTLYPISYTLP